MSRYIFILSETEIISKNPKKLIKEKNQKNSKNSKSKKNYFFVNSSNKLNLLFMLWYIIVYCPLNLLFGVQLTSFIHYFVCKINILCKRKTYKVKNTKKINKTEKPKKNFKNFLKKTKKKCIL